MPWNKIVSPELKLPGPIAAVSSVNIAVLALVMLCIDAFALVVLAGLNPWLLPQLTTTGVPAVILDMFNLSTSLSKSLNATTSLTFAANSCLLICVTACSKLLAFAKSTSTLVFDVVV